MARFPDGRRGNPAPAEKTAPDMYFVGTPQRIVEAMLALAHVTAADTVYDLGSGEGRRLEESRSS